MKLVTLCFLKMQAPDGISGMGAYVGGGLILKPCNFNFVRYNPNDEKMVEPVNAFPRVNPEDNTTIGQEGEEIVYIEGIEFPGKLDATGFDDARDV